MPAPRRLVYFANGRALFDEDASKQLVPIVDPDDGMSQDEVGRALGISRQRVQQIEDRALRKLAAGIGEHLRPRVLRGAGRAKHR